ncbi:MAG: TonB-dependent receptor [Pseudomonadota bacterium]
MKTRLLAASAAALSAALSAASAQDVDEDGAASEDRADRIAIVDEIVVYTQKREQVSQDVPIAVTSFGQERLDRLGVQQFDDLADFVPGLEIQEQSPNNPGFVIRGITSDSGAANIEPRITIFQDGVSISRSRGSFVELFDATVEVARGPQSTLFGRSALIGAINIIQNKPTYETAFSGRAGAGNLGFQLYEGVANIPILEDQLAVRLAARYKKRDGYVENALGGTDFNSVELGAFRGSLRFDPSETFRADLIINYQRDNNSGTSFKSGTFIPDGGEINPSSPAALNAFGPFEGAAGLGLDREVTSVTMLMEWAASDAITINSVTGWREFDSLEIFDPDGFAAPLFVFGEEAVGDQFSQELRVRYDNGGPITGFVGASYFQEDGFQRVPLEYDERVVQGLLGGFLFTGVPGLPQPTPDFASFPAVNLAALPNVVPLKPIHAEEFTNFGETEAIDVFADVSYRPTDRLEIIAGARYTHDDKTAGFAAGNINGPSALTGAGIFLGASVFNNNTPVFVSDSFGGFTWRGVVNYEASDELNLYFNYGRGRRPEVLEIQSDTATVGVSPDEVVVIPAETVNSYEVGAKGRFFEGALSVDLAGYYYAYANFQSSRVNDVGAIETINAGNADAYGVELSVIGQVADWAQVFVNYAYNRARFDDFNGDGEAQAFAGNQFRLSPDHAFSVGGTFSYQTPYGAIGLTPIYSFRSKVFFDDNNDLAINPRNGAILQPTELLPPALAAFQPDLQDEFQDAFGTLDLRLRFDSADARWGLEFFVENVFDKEFIIDAGNTGDAFGIPTFIAGPPRLFGGYVNVRF